MSKKRLRPEDVLALNKAEDLTTIVSYRLAVVSNDAVTSSPQGLVLSKKLTYLSVGEVNPFCDELCTDDIVKFKTPEEAEAVRDKYVSDMQSVGMNQRVVVAGVNAGGTILAIDGEYTGTPEDEVVDEFEDWRDDECEGGQCNMDGVCDKHRGK